MTTTPTPDAVAVELAHVAPSTLVMADNVRSNAADSLTKPFIASIRERGVLEPIIVDGTTDGVLTVRAGHRRTLAAIEAGTATVPVMIHTGEHARVDRLIDQIVENEHRAGLSNRDKIAAVEQLALEGLTEGQIAKRAALPKKDVAAAVRIAASTVAQFSDQLSLEQAAAMAEFDDNPDAVEKLLDAAQRGQFAHTLSRLQTDRIIEAATAEMVIRVEAAGLTATTGHLSWDGPADTIGHLRTADGQPITEEEHAGCPGHATRITTEYKRARFYDDDEDEEENEVEQETEADPWSIDAGVSNVVALLICTDWKANGHHNPYRSNTGSTAPRAADMSDAEREAAKIARRRVIENNKAWDAAEPVRRAWLAEFAHRKAAPAGAEALIAEAAARSGGFDMKGWGDSPWQSVGVDRSQLVVTDATAKRCTHITLMHLLVAWESNTTRETWRQADQWSRRILTAIAGWGYTLSDVEQEVTDTTPQD